MEHNEQFPTPLFMATNRLCAVTNLLKQRPRPDPDPTGWCLDYWRLVHSRLQRDYARLDIERKKFVP
jgi:hypothetical protein